MFEGKYGTYWISDGILFVDYKPDLIVTLKVAERITRDRMEFQQDKEYPIFSNLDGIIGTHSEARHYLVHEGSLLIKALALYSTSPIAIRLTEFYLRTLTHKIPTQLFQYKNNALRFLEPYTQ